jgi:hypothetical protein
MEFTSTHRKEIMTRSKESIAKQKATIKRNGKHKKKANGGKAFFPLDAIPGTARRPLRATRHFASAPRGDLVFEVKGEIAAVLGGRRIEGVEAAIRWLTEGKERPDKND